jgi:G3E family GTPase
LIVNKIDMIDDDKKALLRKVLKWLQPTATYIETNNGQVDIEKIVGTGLFNFDEATQSAGWIQELQAWHAHHTPETEEYGISSFVYRAEKPFHPQRLWDLVQYNRPSWVIRSKWMLWLPTSQERWFSWSQAWWSTKVWLGGRRIASFWSQELEQAGPEYQSYYNLHKHKKYWDRAQELVIIGIHPNKDEIISLFDAALMSDEEIQQLEAWQKFHDPFAEIVSMDVIEE